MKVWQTFPLALKALARNKVRSLLTTLGVVIGVASVISMVAVGEGARARVEGVFATMGTNMLIVLSGSTSSGGLMGGFGSMPTLTWDDLTAIRSQAPSVRTAAPGVSARVTLLSDETNWTTGVFGTTREYFDVRAWKAANGSAFSDEDVAMGAKVMVLGRTAADKLFGAGIDPVGRNLRVRESLFQIIGVLERKGQSPMGTDYDDVALIPVTTFQTKVQGGLQKYIAGAILVSATSAADTSRAQPDGARQCPTRGHARAHRAARGHRRGLAARGRHRHHEHHVGQRHRTHARDRRADGRRSQTVARAVAVPGRIDDALDGGRHHRRARRSRGGDVGGGPSSITVHHARGHGSPCVRLQRARRHRLRHLSGAQSGASRSHRSAALRVTRPAGSATPPRPGEPPRHALLLEPAGSRAFRLRVELRLEGGFGSSRAPLRIRDLRRLLRRLKQLSDLGKRVRETRARAGRHDFAEYTTNHARVLDGEADADSGVQRYIEEELSRPAGSAR
jgi:hypothetical protein